MHQIKFNTQVIERRLVPENNNLLCLNCQIFVHYQLIFEPERVDFVVKGELIFHLRAIMVWGKYFGNRNVVFKLVI